MKKAGEHDHRLQLHTPAGHCFLESCFHTQNLLRHSPLLPKKVFLYLFPFFFLLTKHVICQPSRARLSFCNEHVDSALTSPVWPFLRPARGSPRGQTSDDPGGRRPASLFVAPAAARGLRLAPGVWEPTPGPHISNYNAALIF